jgi:hypothetical protein
MTHRRKEKFTAGQQTYFRLPGAPSVGAPHPAPPHEGGIAREALAGTH